MHWYVGFQDPAPPADPSLFEWAGGRPALTRMTRLLYEKHVPADPLLAPLFAGAPPGLARREALAMAAAFGGPAGEPLPGRPELSEEQRARWVTLATAAAEEAQLPADPEFRAAFVGYLEWVSGKATAEPAPRWDWTAAGRPVSPPAAAAGQEGEPVTLPGPDEPVSFATHIKPLFRDKDRQSMSFAFDLWAVDDVRAHAAGILDRLSNGSMPCDGAWPAEQVAVFRRWTESGCPG
jgi:truncated hemoglobin YjbI